MPESARETIDNVSGWRSSRLLRWLAFLLPTLIFGSLAIALVARQGELTGRPVVLLIAGVVLVGLALFYGSVFALLEQKRNQLSRDNRELQALHSAALDIYGELSLDEVLRKVVGQARSLLSARYGALSVIDEGGRIQEFVVSGVTPEERAAIGDPPTGNGILGEVLHEGQRLRLEEISRHPKSAGFPPNHPTMTSLLAVPITCKTPFRGNLYLADKETDTPFSLDDEETLARFASKAAVAIDNAHLHQRLRSLAVTEERLRIARELHDGMAQVLAYVNAKAQAVKTFLEGGRAEEAERHLDQLATAARDVLTDAREGILGLRTDLTETSLTAGLESFVQTWGDQSGIRGTVELDEHLALAPMMELQLLRIVQESLANVRKHSGATWARVKLHRDTDAIVVTVEDNGDGFDVSGPKASGLPRFGLAIMRERAESIGGVLVLDSTPGKGTQVRVEVPVSR